MPSVEESLFAILSGGAAGAIVSTRIYPDKLPQNVTYPALRYQRISTARAQYRVLDRSSQNKATRQEPRMQVDCYAVTRSAANALAVAVRSDLDGYSGTSASLTIDRSYVEEEDASLEEGVGDGQADIYRTRLDFLITHQE